MRNFWNNLKGSSPVPVGAILGVAILIALAILAGAMASMSGRMHRTGNDAAYGLAALLDVAFLAYTVVSMVRNRDDPSEVTFRLAIFFGQAIAIGCALLIYSSCHTL